MSRPRSFEPGLTMHVMQRGNNRMEVFRHGSDFETFLLLMKRAAARYDGAVHAYALMNNHYHLMVTPESAAVLARMMQYVNSMYARYFNRSCERTGSLWTGRYRALVLTDSHYWLTCLQYVEHNPVRAHIVERPEDYRWSSYCAHAMGTGTTWLAPHPVYDALGPTPHERRAAYRTLSQSALSEEQLLASRCSLLDVVLTV